MGDRVRITIEVPCEVEEEVFSGNAIYLASDHTVRWLYGDHVVAESSEWTAVDV